MIPSWPTVAHKVLNALRLSEGRLDTAELAIDSLDLAVAALPAQHYATTAARNAANPTPDEGNMAVVDTPKSVWIYNGTYWVPLSVEKTAYTAVLTSSGGDADTGNGASKAYYTISGELCTAWGRILWGTSGVNVGTGNYQIPLPFASQNSIELFVTPGWVRIFDASASGANARRGLVPILGGGQAFTTCILPESGQLYGASGLAGWIPAANDWTAWHMTYPIDLSALTI